MSPTMVPFSTMLGTCTSPWIEPVSLTDSEPPGPSPQRTPPTMRPSRCRPPSNSRSPCTRAALPIRVSIRVWESRVNMPSGSGWMGLGGGLDVPQEGLRQRRDVVTARLHLHRQLVGLEGERHHDLLVERLQV